MCWLVVDRSVFFFFMFEVLGEDVGDEDLGDDCIYNVEKKRRLMFD